MGCYNSRSVWCFSQTLQRHALYISETYNNWWKTNNRGPLNTLFLVFNSIKYSSCPESTDMWLQSISLFLPTFLGNIAWTIIQNRYQNQFLPPWIRIDWFCSNNKLLFYVIPSCSFSNCKDLLLSLSFISIVYLKLSAALRTPARRLENEIMTQTALNTASWWPWWFIK